MRHDRGVGAHRDLDPRLGGKPHRVELRPAEPLELLADLRCELLVVGQLLGGVARRQGRHEPRAAFHHELGGLLVEIRPVLDRANARVHGALDALRAVRMGHDPAVEIGGRAHDHVELVLCEMRVLRVVGGREEPAGGGDLDHVGAGPDHLAHLASHAVYTVAHTVGEAGVGQPAGRDATARQHLVVVSRGLAEHRDRHLHPRADEHAVPDRLAQTRVRAPGVADRRDPEPQRRQEVRRRLIEAVGERPVLHRQLVVLVHAGEMHVRVEQPRHQRLARAVDTVVAVEPGAHLDDLPVVDRDIGIGQRRHRAVEDLPTVEHRPGHSVPSSSWPPPTLRRAPYLEGASRGGHATDRR